MNQYVLRNGQLRAVEFLLRAYCLVICLSVASIGGATGLHGRLTDALDKQPIAGATIILKGTRISTTTDFKGEYTLTNIKPGVIRLLFKAVGYADETDSVIVVNGEERLLDKSLSPVRDSLPEVAVQGYTEPGTEKNARRLQRIALPITEIVSAEAIEHSTDLSIAEVTRRVTGLSLSTESSGDGGRTIIRGMDPKYNYTLVNGIKIPSPGDRARYVPLSVFPADIVQRVEVYKTLTPDMEGDAIGGVVNMVLKDAPQEAMFTIRLMAGYNQAFFNSGYLSFNRQDIQEKSPYQLHGPTYAATSSDFTKSNLSFRSTHPFPDIPGSITWGRRFFNKKMGVLVAGDYQEIKKGSIGFFIPQNNEPQLDNAPGLTDFYRNRYNTTIIRKGLHAKLDYVINSNNSIGLYQFFTSQNDIETRYRVDTSLTQGRTIPGTGSISVSNRSRLHIQNLYSASLIGRHSVGKYIAVNWSAAYSMATGLYPDWAELSYRTGRIENPNGEIVQSPSLLEPMTRIWLRNSEADLSGNLHIDYHRKVKTKEITVSTGGLSRGKSRDNFYNAYIFQPAITTSQGQPFTDIYHAEWTNNNGPQNPLGSVANPNTYTAHEYINAAYLSAKIKGAKAEWSGGVRFEDTRQQFVSSIDPTSSYGKYGSIRYHDFLPSIEVKYSISSNQLLKASWYKSISRPVLYDVTFYSIAYDDYKEAGNPFLKRAVANNIDVRYEWYPAVLDQLLGGVFYKHVANPYERTLLNAGDELYPEPTQGLSYTPAGELTAQVRNAADANDYGFELSGTKYFGKIGLQAGYTYTYSRIVQATKYKTREDPANTASNLITVTRYETRPLQGQSPSLANVSIIYKDSRHGWDARLYGIYTGRRIYSVSGWYGLDYWQRAYWVIDASVEKKITPRVKIFAKASNLFNTVTAVDLLKNNPSFSSGVIPAQQQSGRINVMRQTEMASYYMGFQWKLR